MYHNKPLSKRGIIKNQLNTITILRFFLFIKQLKVHMQPFITIGKQLQSVNAHTHHTLADLMGMGVATPLSNFKNKRE